MKDGNKEMTNFTNNIMLHIVEMKIALQERLAAMLAAILIFVQLVRSPIVSRFFGQFLWIVVIFEFIHGYGYINVIGICIQSSCNTMTNYTSMCN